MLEGVDIGQPAAGGRTSVPSARIKHAQEAPLRPDGRQEEKGTERGTVLASDLAAIEDGLDADLQRTAQRLADAALRDELVAAGFTGPRYMLFETDATYYGLAVIIKWLATGEIYQRAAAVRRPVPRPPLALSVDERLGLAGLVVAEGLKYFKQSALRDGQWRPERGASLKTFFIGACLLRFKAAFAAWRPDSVVEEVPTDLIFELCELPPSVASSVPDQALLHLRAWGGLKALDDPVVRKILVCHAAGLLHAEIAAVVGHGLTAASVAARLKRLQLKGAQA